MFWRPKYKYFHVPIDGYWVERGKGIKKYRHPEKMMYSDIRRDSNNSKQKLTLLKIAKTKNLLHLQQQHVFKGLTLLI